MNAKSKFSIPILSGTRPEVGLFSATVAAPSLRNASNLVSGVAVSSYPMVTTGVTSNNSIVPTNLDGEQIYRYPGTNTLLADWASGATGLTFFYTDVLFAQQNYGENLKKSGAQIPGVSRGAPTQKYLTRVLRRITLPGALFLGLVAILPWLIGLIVPFGASTGLLLVSSAGLLIVVGVVRDTFFNIEAELKLHGYDDTLLVR